MESNRSTQGDIRFGLIKMGAFLTILILFCCNTPYTKKGYIQDFTSFVNRVNRDSKNYTRDKWIAVDKEFEKYSREDFEKFRTELTKEELSAVGNLRAIYSTVKLRQSAKDELEKVKKLFDQVKSIGGGPGEPAKN